MFAGVNDCFGSRLWSMFAMSFSIATNLLFFYLDKQSASNVVLDVFNRFI